MRIFCLILWVFLIPFCAQAGLEEIFVNGEPKNICRVQIVYVRKVDPKADAVPEGAAAAVAQGDDIRQANLSDYHTIPRAPDLGVDHKNFLNDACAKAAEGAQKYPELAGVQVIFQQINDGYDGYLAQRHPSGTGLHKTHVTFNALLHLGGFDSYRRIEPGFLGHYFQTEKQFQDLLDSSACVLPMGPKNIPTLLVFMPVPTFNDPEAAPLFNQIAFAERADHVFGAFDVLAENAINDQEGLDNLFFYHDFRMPLHGPNAPYSVSSKSPGLLEILRCSGKDAVRHVPDPMAVVAAGKQNIMRCIQRALTMAECFKNIPIYISDFELDTLRRYVKRHKSLSTSYENGPIWIKEACNDRVDCLVSCNISGAHLVIKEDKQGFWEPYCIDTIPLSPFQYSLYSIKKDTMDDTLSPTCLESYGMCKRSNDALPENTCVVLVKDLLEAVRARPWPPKKPLIWKDFVEAAEKAIPGADIVSVIQLANKNYQETKGSPRLSRKALNDKVRTSLPVQRWVNRQAQTDNAQEATDNAAPENPNTAHGAAAAAAAVPENNPPADDLSGWQHEVIEIKSRDLYTIAKYFLGNLDAIYDVCPAGSGASIKAVAKRPAKK